MSERSISVALERAERLEHERGVDGPREHHGEAVMPRRDEDAVVHAPVGIVERAHPFVGVDVDRTQHVAERVGGGDELAQLGFCRALGRDFDGVRLEADAQPVEVDDFRRRERADHRAAVALADDEAFGFEHAQRFAHRCARQPELLGDALLDEPLPRRVAVLDDRGADLRRTRARRRPRRPSCSRLQLASPSYAIWRPRFSGA